MVIGLTGVYCAGKNHIAAILEKMGFPVLDVDKLGHQVLETEKEKILAQFGQELLKPDGSLDRRLLGQLVHGNTEKLMALEAIVHPGVNRLTNEWINGIRNESVGMVSKKVEDRVCVINAAVLHKSSVFEKLDKIILVKAPFITRFLRAKRRDRLSWREIKKRFASQEDFYTQYLSKNAEIYIVENPGILKSSFREKKLKSKIYEIFEGI